MATSSKKRSLKNTARKPIGSQKWVPIGVFGVDSGEAVIGDPCYSEYFNGPEEGIPGLYFQNKFPQGHEGAGVTFRTGLGDGVYTVEARLVRGPKEWGGGMRVREIRVRFY